MKEFRMELVSPPQGIYFPGQMVTGTVICVTDEPKDYKQIVVTLDGGARVHWSESSGSGNNRRTHHYTSTEHYMTAQAVVWSNTSTADGKFPPGSFRFDFSIQLAQGIPASYTGTVGRITYSLEARVVKSGLLKMDTKAVANLNVGSIIQSASPQLMQPLSMETSKTLCCCCCASDPIVMRARIPRTGFCIGYDTIPVEVTVENGSSRQINNVRVALEKRVLYTAQGRHRHDNITCAVYNSTRVVGPRETTAIQMEPMQVPAVYGEVSFAFNPTVSLPVVIGNVTSNTSGGGGANPPPTQYITEGFPNSDFSAPPTVGSTWEPPPAYSSNPMPLGFVDPIKKM